MKWYYASLVTALCALSVWGCFGLNHHLILALDAWGNSAPNLTPTVTKANATLDTVNAGAKDVFAESRAVTIAMVDKGRPGKPETMGLIPAVKFMAEDADEQVKQSAKLVDASTGAIAGAAQDVHTMAVAGTATLGTAQTTIQSMQGPIQGLSVSENNFNALLRNSAITRTLDNVAGVTGNMDDTSRDLKKVADRMTTDYLKPVPLWKRPFKYFGTTWDILGAVARHTP